MEQFWNVLWTYGKVFVIGGVLCAIAQLFLIKTKWTPSRILVGFLLIGVFLEAIQVFEPIKQFAQAGVTVPIVGFGASLARGAIEAVREMGILGAFAGGLAQTAIGVGAAIIFSFVTALVFKPHLK